jgi:hypothetical protein
LRKPRSIKNKSFKISFSAITGNYFLRSIRV